MPATPEISPLGPVVGALVRGVDPGGGIDGRTADSLRRAFARHALLCVRGRRMSASEQARFAGVFGPVDSGHRARSGAGGEAARRRGVMLVSNIRRNGEPIGSLPDGDMQFHSDGAHRDVPYMATSLYAVRVPSRGGDTLFADLAAAYDALDDGVRGRIDGLRVRNTYNYDDTSRDGTPDEGGPDSSSAVHDLVRTHPDTGRRSLYLSRLMTRRVIGVGRRESDRLLERLFAHIERPEFIYVHKWRVGDLLVWDNRRLNHARTDFPADEPRLMRRYTITETGPR